MYLSSLEMSLQSTDDDSFDYSRHTQSAVTAEERTSLVGDVHD